MKHQAPDLTVWEQRLIHQWRALSPDRRVPNRSGPAGSAGASLRHTPSGAPRSRGQHFPDSSALPPDRLTPAELDRAAADLLTLQRGLTGERHLIGSVYMDESRRLGAYLLFYWFTSYAQTWGMLDMALSARRALHNGSGAAPFRILDLGSGPAPCGLAAADWLRAAFHVSEIELTACDQSTLALRLAGELAQSAGVTLRRVAPWRAGPDTIPADTYNCIVMGHLLNELWKDEPDRLEQRTAFLEALGNRLEAGGILVILEPALLGTGRDLLVLRDRLVRSGWHILAPCFTQGPCPAAAQPNQTCHSDFAWKPPRIVRELERRTGLDKDLIKTTALVLSRSMSRPVAVETIDRLYRVVSEPMLNKAGRTRLILCGKEGRIPLSTRLGEGFPAEKVFKQLRRSDAIFLHQPEQRETGLALGPETRITRL
ncbi:Ribosomal small subunit Rsm22 [Gracilinema caldarium DSM 7334]|uniref:Ribosomal small subunit Rsm22 n=2 Tax=Gracilinema caldarium TaxID=215591 RepID=F8EZL8_GRAC1|nr:Ribosomal small subunit Rsm22 [Gracilinema caldarium DSM 7334]